MFSDRIYELYAKWEAANEGGVAFDLPKHCSTPEERAELDRLIAQMSPAQSSPDEPVLPADTGRYQFTRFLARGGMGEVYVGEDTVLHRTVAIKVLRQKLGVSAARFQDEALLVAKLSHPGIVPVHDFGELADGRPFFVMKLVEGKTLEEVLGDSNAQSPHLPRWLQYFEQICQAVAYAHSQNPPLLHRDLKPSNVMIGAYGEVLVMDWGIARVVAEPTGTAGFANLSRNTSTSGSTESTTVDDDQLNEREQTVTGVAKGTIAYMAPEQARGEREKIGTYTDVFALGGILCRILTGKPTYCGGDGWSRAVSGELSDAFGRLDRCGASVDLILLAKQCLAPDSTRRFAEAGSLGRELRRHLDSVQDRLKRAEVERARAETKAEGERKRRKVLVAFAVSVLVLLVGGGSAGWWYKLKASLNHDQMGSSLEQVEESLRNEDSLRAAIYLEQAEKRLAEAGATRLRGRFEQCKEDLALLKELDRINDARWELVKGVSQLDGDARAVREWPGAFRRIGVVPGQTPPDEAASRIGASLVKEQLLAALDLWLAFAEPPERQALAEVLAVVDGDTFRDNVRRAWVAGDDKAIVRLAKSDEAIQQPPRFAIMLGNLSILPVDRRRAILTAAHRSRPRNFALLMDLGELDPIDDPATAGERISWYRAAVAIRPENAAAHNNLGVALHDRDDFDGAITEYREAIRLDPSDADAHNNLGLALRDKNELDEAIAAYRMAIHFNAADADTHIHLGDALRDKRDLPGAVAAYREAIRLDPKNAEAHRRLGVALTDKKELDGAVAACREAIRLDPKDAVAHRHLGAALYHKDDLDGAVAACREAIRLDPMFAPAHNVLGLALLDKKDLDGAVAAFKEAVRLNPKFAVAFSNLSIALRDKKELNGAVTACRTAIRLDPTYASAHNNLGNCLRDKKDLDRAIAAFREAIRLNPTYAVAHNNLGNCLRDQKDLDGAISEHRVAIRLDPSYAAAHNSLGNALRDKKDLDGAVAAYSEAMRLDPRDAAAHNNLGAALQDKKELDKAIARYREAIRLSPAYATAYGNLGNALREKKDLEGAVTACREAIRLDPTSAIAQNYLGIALRDNKDLDEAVAAYREAIRLDPRFAAAHVNLGNALRDKKDLDGSIAAYREAIRLDPTYAAANNNLGSALFVKKDLDAAIAAYREAIRLEPGYVHAHANLGLALSAKKDSDGAMAEYEATIRLDSNNANAHNLLAWLLAVGPSHLRDGKRAVEHATRACEITAWKNPMCLDTLAAACAQAGNFEKAINFERKALSFPVFEKESGPEARTRLELYLQKKSYQDPKWVLTPPERGPSPRVVMR
jgi:tetratricopeptide (TPR) repeat protein